jgi:hypothetical protein
MHGLPSVVRERGGVFAMHGLHSLPRVTGTRWSVCHARFNCTVCHWNVPRGENVGVYGLPFTCLPLERHEFAMQGVQRDRARWCRPTTRAHHPHAIATHPSYAQMRIQLQATLLKGTKFEKCSNCATMIHCPHQLSTRTRHAHTLAHVPGLAHGHSSTLSAAP